MICYMAKDLDGRLYPLPISTQKRDSILPDWPILTDEVKGWLTPMINGWTVVQVEIRECDEKRKRLEDTAGELLEACKEAIKTLGDFMQDHYGQNQHVLGWHLNGDPEPMDSFLEADNFHETIEALLSAIAKAEGK